MSPPDQDPQPIAARFPRTRGDEPEAGSYSRDRWAFSPHTRG